MATKTTSTATKKKKAPIKRVSAEDIRLRAEQIYKARVNNGRHGDALSDWLQAEKELSGVR